MGEASRELACELRVKDEEVGSEDLRGETCREEEQLRQVPWGGTEGCVEGIKRSQCCWRAESNTWHPISVTLKKGLI